MLESYPTQEEAAEAASAEFLRLAAGRAFSSPAATHYHIQLLANGSVTLSMGSFGTITQTDDRHIAVADITAAVTISRELLEMLASHIVAARTAEAEGKAADGE